MRNRPTQFQRIVYDPLTDIEKLQGEYLRSMVLANRSDRTMEYWAMNLFKFNSWCHERGIDKLEEITSSILKRYREHVFHYRNPTTNKKLKFSTQHCYLIVVRRFFTWLFKNGHLETDIARNIEIPKAERRLPKEVFTAEEVESIMNETDIRTRPGVRDRAVIETFYSTGIRCTELCNLELFDLDEDRRSLTIRQGKGKKDRIVPIGDRAISWIKKYVSDVRPVYLSRGEGNQYLFLNQLGNQMERGYTSSIIRKYKEKAGIKKPGSCHMLRHTAATLMMDNGADLRSLQEFLGHARLATTQIYTHVSINRLQEVHRRTHPASVRKKPDTSE